MNIVYKILEKLGIPMTIQTQDAKSIRDITTCVLELERRVKRIETDINGLKMEANILYAKTMTVEDVT